ncbi:MAG TPA: hypothetical protein VMR46_01540 [Candidatus Paceibacterota bacterium]|nr:hypothetical protein [Candidatus Paceibacterota bacterium]
METSDSFQRTPKEKHWQNEMFAKNLGHLVGAGIFIIVLALCSPKLWSRPSLDIWGNITWGVGVVAITLVMAAVIVVVMGEFARYIYNRYWSKS